ncbi:hypothetical protein D9M72_335200 [compost metagenome]
MRSGDGVRNEQISGSVADALRHVDLEQAEPGLAVLPLRGHVVSGVADGGRIDDSVGHQLKDEFHGFHVAVVHQVQFAVLVPDAAAIVDHHHDHGVVAVVVAGACTGGEAEGSDLLERLAGFQEGRPVGGESYARLLEQRLAVPEHAHVQLPGDSDVALVGLEGVEDAGKEVIELAVLLQLVNDLVRVRDLALLLELEGLEAAAGGHRGAGLRRDGRGERLVEVVPLDDLVAGFAAGSGEPFCELLGGVVVSGGGPRHVPELDRPARAASALRSGTAAAGGQEGSGGRGGCEAQEPPPGEGGRGDGGFGRHGCFLSGPGVTECPGPSRQ